MKEGCIKVFARTGLKFYHKTTWPNFTIKQFALCKVFSIFFCYLEFEMDVSEITRFKPGSLQQGVAPTEGINVNY